MGVKILAINGSPRNSGTQYALEYALKAASEIGDVETELVNLRGKELNFCIHCNRCIKEDILFCPTFDDAMTEIYPKILEADGLIIGSPVYQMSPNAQITTFFNRLRPLGKLISKGKFGLKVAGGIAVGGARNGGQDTTLEGITNMLLASGYIVASGSVFAYNGGSMWSQGANLEGAKNDEVGLATVSMIGHRIAVLAKVLQEGAKHTDYKEYQYAGFVSEEEILARRSAFKKG